MIRAKYISKERNKHGIIIRYSIYRFDLNKIITVEPSQLKQAIRDNKIVVDGITLTSDNRLIDKKANRVENNNDTINESNYYKEARRVINEISKKAKIGGVSANKYIYKYLVENNNEITKILEFNERKDSIRFKNWIVALDYYQYSTYVTDMQKLFEHCNSDRIHEVSKLDISNVTNMHKMFCNCKATYLDLRTFDTSKVTDMSDMFAYCKYLKGVNLSSFDTSNVKRMEEMFYHCEKLERLDVKHFNTSNLWTMNAMFASCIKLRKLDLSSFDTSNVIDSKSLFSMCHSLEKLNLSNFNTSQMTDLSCMFYECISLKYIDLSSFVTDNVISMLSMFFKCEKLKELDLSNFNTEHVYTMGSMFQECNELEKLNLSSFVIDQIDDKNLNSMFLWCSNLRDLNIRKFNLTDRHRFMLLFEKANTKVDFEKLEYIGK